MDNFIKIPKDFESINDLKDLVNNYEFTSRLQTALNDYQQTYLIHI